MSYAKTEKALGVLQQRRQGGSQSPELTFRQIEGKQVNKIVEMTSDSDQCCEEKQ